MNPQFVRTPAEMSAVREQYMSNLRLQLANEQKNLNANKILKYTGEPPSQIEDTRTADEKFQDLQTLRTNIKDYLTSTGYLTASRAEFVVNQLTEEENQFIFRNKRFIDRDYLSRDVPPQVFLDFIRAYIAKYEKTAGVELGLQQTGEPVISNNQINNRIIGTKELDSLAEAIELVPAMSWTMRDVIASVKFNISVLRELLPTASLLNKIDNLSPAQQADIKILLNEALRDLPSKSQVLDNIRLLEQAKDRNDSARMYGIAKVLQDMLAVDEASKKEINVIKEEVESEVLKKEIETGFSTEETPKKETGGRKPRTPKTPERRGDIDDKINSISEGLSLSINDLKAWLTTSGLGKALKYRDGRSLAPSNLKRNIVSRTNLEDLISIYLEDKNILGDEIKSRKFDPSMRTFLTDDEIVSSPEGTSLTGRGIRQKPSKKSIVDRVAVVREKPKVYVPFGKYYINKEKLEDNILMVKSLGGFIVAWKTRRISPLLTKLIKLLLADETPDYNIVSKLSTEDKKDLYDLCKVTKYDKIKIDTPMKDLDEQEENRFEVLKGSILAGNDNPKVIREFKALLIKFLHEKRIPRVEANEILKELVILGH